MSTRLIQALLVMVAAGVTTPVAAQQGSTSSSGAPSSHLAAGAISAAYTQTSSNSGTQESDTSSAVKGQGTVVDAGFDVMGLDADLGYDSLTSSKSDWYKSRHDLSLALGAQFDAVPWLIPSVGLYELDETSDRGVADAPIAFIDKTTTFSLGVRAEGMPLEFDGQGLLLRGRAVYLTNGQAKANFGTIYEANAGYGYKDGTFEAGLTVGFTRTYVDASTVDAGVTRNVRSILQGNLISIYLAY